MLYSRAPYVPPSGTTASPSGLAPFGVRLRSATQNLRFRVLRSAKDKSVVADAPHTKACFKKGMLACARTKAYQTTKDKLAHKGVFFGVCAASIAPRRTRAMHQCVFSEVAHANECPPSGFTLASASQSKALHKGVFYDLVGREPTKSVLRGHDTKHRLSRLIQYAWPPCVSCPNECHSFTSAIQRRVL